MGGVVPEGVEASSFGAGVREREIGGVGMDLEEHGGRADDTAVVGEFGKVAKQSFLGGKNGGSRFRLEGGEGSDSFKGGDIVGPGIVEGRANDFLKLGGLSGGGRGGGVSGGKLRGGGSIDGRDIDGGGGSMLDTVGAVSLEHVGDIGGHGGGDGAGNAVVDDGLTKESVSNGVGFYMVFSGESIYKAVEVGDVTVFDAVVVNYEGKINGVDCVGEEAGLELVVAMGQQEGSDLLVGMEARLLKTRNGFIAAGIKKWFALFILLDKRGDAEAGEDGRGKKGGMDDEEFRGGHVVTEVEIGNVESAKRSVFRDGGVEEDIDHRHRGGAGGDRV